MIKDIDAIAFDIDGTLYPDVRLYLRLLPFLVKNALFMYRFGLVRKEIRLWQEAHPEEKHEDFFRWQASLYARRAACSVEAAQNEIFAKIYEGWKPLFLKVKPYKFAYETIEACKAQGLKIGLLSDFLPSQKDSVWGIVKLCDVVLGSEQTGALKPSPIPFLALSEALQVPCSRILYVGNSITSDVQGASRVGMKTACIQPFFRSFFGLKKLGADISFHSYRQLLSFVIK